jgi:hypothetical protein
MGQSVEADIYALKALGCIHSSGLLIDPCYLSMLLICIDIPKPQWVFLFTSFMMLALRQPKEWKTVRPFSAPSMMLLGSHMK